MRPATFSALFLALAAAVVAAPNPVQPVRSRLLCHFFVTVIHHDGAQHEARMGGGGVTETDWKRMGGGGVTETDWKRMGGGGVTETDW